MSDDLSLDSMMNELQLFLKSKARNLPCPTRSLVFRLDNKNNLKIVDSDKQSFEVEEFFLESFREVFSDKQYKYVKVNNWEFELELSDKKCNRIILNADNVVFIANKNTKKQLKDVAFRTVVSVQEQIDQFSKESKGFIRRIIKKHLLGSAENVNEEFYSLISFVKRPTEFKVQRVTNGAEEQTEEQHPMEYLTPAGRKIVDKLRNFITRQDVFEFLVKQELSSNCETQIRNIVLSQKSSGQSKKRVKAE